MILGNVTMVIKVIAGLRLLNQERADQCCKPGFLNIVLSAKLCAYVFSLLRLLITSGVM